jgi:hypothetical protein
MRKLLITTFVSLGHLALPFLLFLIVPLIHTLMRQPIRTVIAAHSLDTSARYNPEIPLTKIPSIIESFDVGLPMVLLLFVDM